jgi:hypothetical protein
MYWPWPNGSNSTDCPVMKYSMHKLFIFAFALPLGLLGQEVVLDSAEVVNADVITQQADLDSAAMALLDARLAQLDSEHLFFNMAKKRQSKNNRSHTARDRQITKEKKNNQRKLQGEFLREKGNKEKRETKK